MINIRELYSLDQSEKLVRVPRRGGGGWTGEVLAYINYMGMCRCEGYVWFFTEAV